jgi:hypothetical protein
VADSESTISTHGDQRIRDIKEWSQGLQRLESTRLQQQRYTPSDEKTEYLSMLALGAKLERALDRRYSSQDAVLRPRPRIVNEKQAPIAET